MSKRLRVEAAYRSKTLAYCGSNPRFEASGPANSSTKMAYWKLRFQPAAFLRSVFWATKHYTGSCLGNQFCYNFNANGNFCQRCRNDDKNKFWEVESKGGVGRGFEKRVNRGPILKFHCRAKAQEKQHFGNRIFIVVAFFPGITVTIILDNYPPSTLQRVGLGGRKNPRIIVGENYCHFGAHRNVIFIPETENELCL